MEEKKPNVLFVDDEPVVTSFLSGVIRRRNDCYRIHVADNPKSALILAMQFKPEIAVIDLCIEHRNPNSGLALIQKFLEIDDTIKVLVLTSMDVEDWGIKCIEAGAANYIRKPSTEEELFTLISNCVTSSQLLRQGQKNSSSAREVFEELGLATKSKAMAAVLDDITLAALTDQPVLICGETGVGKTFIANLLHRAGLREKGPLVRSQPGCGSHDLVMSELFGHMRGAYTGATENRRGLIEQAHGGTLFIDEIDQFTHEVQVALLHVLQTKEYSAVGSSQKKVSNFRLISATNCPDHELIEKNRLREDFYHRIAKLKIHIPPLRKRVEDIPDIARSILSEISKNDSARAYDFNREAMTWMCGQSWKGNIRELEGVVELGYLHAKRSKRNIIRVSDLIRSVPKLTDKIDGTLSEQLRAFEYSIAWLEFAKNYENHSATARSLGIDRKRLRKILKQSGVSQ